MNKIENKKPLVSIVIVTYNSSQYVLETLESAKAQTYPNIELIVTDDCSKDNTVEICRDWMKKNKERFVRTELITVTKNTGTPGNCNRGVKASSGEWIKFIAGDDILLDNCIIENLKFGIENDSEFIFSDMIWFNDSVIIKEQDNQGPMRRKFAETAPKFQLHFYSRHPVFLNSPTWFFSSKIFTNNFFDESFRILEDQTFVLSHLENDGLISFLNKETIMYRKHNNSVQYIKGSNFIQDFELCFNKYRRKNLRYSSIIDLLFVIKFKTLIFSMENQNTKIKKIIASILTRINPIKIFKINPSFLAKQR